MSITSVLSHTGLVLSKHAPAILTTVGVVSMGAATVTGVIKALDYDSAVLSPTRLNLERIRTVAEDSDNGKTLDEYDQKARRQDIAQVYTGAVIATVKKFWLPATLAIGGAICIAKGYGINSRRIVALSAAYSAVAGAYKNLVGRINNAVTTGDIKESVRDRLLNHAYEETDTVNEDERAQKSSVHPYVFDFETDNPNYSSTETNLAFIAAQQQYANDRLKSRGYLFLNDVLDSLGIDRVPEGQLVGWVRNGHGDGYVDFQTALSYEMNPEDLPLDWEKSNKIYSFDFNVDGIIWNMI